MNEKDFADKITVVYVCTQGPDCSHFGMQDQTADTESSQSGGKGLYDALKTERTMRGLKRGLKVVRTGCQGWCGHAPVATVWPKGSVHHVTPSEAYDFLTEVEKNGEDARRRVYDMTQSHVANAALKNK
jgi:(2Fe-2S) ferredoxin